MGGVFKASDRVSFKGEGLDLLGYITRLVFRPRWKLQTVEHFLAAMDGVGIENAIVEVDGPEIPIMDGSSEEFAIQLEAARSITPTMVPHPRVKVCQLLSASTYGVRGRNWRASPTSPLALLSFHGGYRCLS